MCLARAHVEELVTGRCLGGGLTPDAILAEFRAYVERFATANPNVVLPADVFRLGRLLWDQYVASLPRSQAVEAVEAS